MANPAPYTTIHHVGLVVSDLERSLAWYHEYFGFELRARTSVPEKGLEFAYIRRGDFELELFMQSGSKRVHGRDVFEAFHQQGIPHLAFGSDDLDATYAWAKNENLTIILEPQSNDAMGVRYFFVVDPDGIQIEFVQSMTGGSASA